MRETADMDFEFTGQIFQWRGPAPFYFVAVPAEDSVDLKAASSMLTYGWGVIPVNVVIGETAWETSLFPRAGRYLVPLKDVVRRAEGLDDGDVISVRLTAGGQA